MPRYLESSSNFNIMKNLRCLHLAVFKDFDKIGKEIVCFDYEYANFIINYRKMKDSELFLRSMYDVKSSFNLLIPLHLNCTTKEQEKEFMDRLEEENPKEFCLYITMKVYHVFLISHKIKINKMKVEFHYGYFRSLFLMNILFVSVERIFVSPGKNRRSITKKRRSHFKRRSRRKSRFRMSRMTRSKISMKTSMRLSVFNSRNNESFSRNFTNSSGVDMTIKDSSCSKNYRSSLRTSKIEEKLERKRNLVASMKERLRNFKDTNMLSFTNKQMKEGLFDKRLQLYIGKGKFPWRKYKGDVMAKSSIASQTKSRSRNLSQVDYNISIDFVETPYSRRKTVKSQIMLPDVKTLSNKKKSMSRRILVGRRSELNPILSGGKLSDFRKNISEKPNKSLDLSKGEITRKLKRNFFRRVSHSFDLSSTRKWNLEPKNIQKNVKLSRLIQKRLFNKKFESITVGKDKAKIIKKMDELYSEIAGKNHEKSFALKPIKKWKGDRKGSKPEGNSPRKKKLFFKKTKKEKKNRKERREMEALELRDFNLSLLLNSKNPIIGENKSTVSTLRHMRFGIDRSDSMAGVDRRVPRIGENLF